MCFWGQTREKLFGKSMCSGNIYKKDHKFDCSSCQGNGIESMLSY